MIRRPPFALFGVLVLIAGAVSYLFGGGGLIAIGGILLYISWLGLFRQPMDVGLRDSADPIESEEQLSRLPKERIAILALGAVLVVIGFFV